MVKRARKTRAVFNADIAAIFEQFAGLLEIDGANPFRVRAYRTAALTLRDMPMEASDLIASGEDLSALPSIGDDLAAKIQEIVRTGRLRAYEDLKKTMPAETAALTRIRRLAPKRVKRMRAR